jgi:ABC-type lipoprotein export system ATPase subunit
MIEVKNLHKTYNGVIDPINVLKGIDLKINKGEFAAIVGPSGAGKSTLLHMIGGLDQPTQGQVFFEKQDLYSLNDAALSRLRNYRIGFVFQFYHLLAGFNARENVIMPLLISQNNGIIRRDALKKGDELLKAVGLSERARHFPSQLSGGEQQRASIARALAHDPDLLLCDEPTGNLDTKNGEEVISLIKQIGKLRQMTVIMVTHNLELVKEADRVYRLKDGVLY